MIWICPSLVIYYIFCMCLQLYVDTVGDVSVYQRKLEECFPSVKITVAKKADSLYPIVSAASICAKVSIVYLPYVRITSVYAGFATPFPCLNPVYLNCVLINFVYSLKAVCICPCFACCNLVIFCLHFCHCITFSFQSFWQQM